jgi:hypothetical protein
MSLPVAAIRVYMAGPSLFLAFPLLQSMLINGSFPAYKPAIRIVLETGIGASIMGVYILGENKANTKRAFAFGTLTLQTPN